MPIPLGIFATAGVVEGGETFEHIQTINGTGSANVISFSSIPQTYKYLQIRWQGRQVAATEVYTWNLRFNSDSGSNYANHQLQGNPSSRSSSGAASDTRIPINYQAGNARTDIFTAGTLQIFDYSVATKFKTTKLQINGWVDIRNGYPAYVALTSGLWQSTAAINAISIATGNGNNFTSDSRFSLYGIRG